MGLKNAREKAGLTQQQTADAMGKTQAAVCQWETGRTAPTAAQLPKLAELYGCTVDELLKEDT
mgnify:CR=1 FL=1